MSDLLRRVCTCLILFVVWLAVGSLTGSVYLGVIVAGLWWLWRSRR